jgi:putative N6-adenine-specific DNA methylase
VHVARDKATLYLDVGGASLHKRGWRTHAGDAPLRETLAAAVLRLSGWDRERPLLDPMCGAGTIAIEAAAWSRRIAPGLGRERFGFERWASHDEPMRAQMVALRREAQAAELPHGPRVFASDADPRAVDLARENARLAGVQLRVERRDVRELAPLEPPGFIVTNPPYGERLEATGTLYEDLGRALRRLPQHAVAVLAGTPAIARAMRREPDRWWILYNGAIECRLLVFSPAGQM